VVDKLISGLAEFKKKDFETHKELFTHLADGQQPEALLITCSDSRIDPNLITQTKPGDIFITRNAGNIVPPYVDVEHAGGVTASIEFAVKALGVEHIIICGHTDCGAMKGAMNPESLESLPHVSMWLGFCAEALETLKCRHEHVDDSHVHEMTEENIKQQLKHLSTHPCVAERLEVGNIYLHGWLYDIAEGTVSCYDEESEKFISVQDRYAGILHAEDSGQMTEDR
jgi:carbonic anhydrase